MTPVNNQNLTCSFPSLSLEPVSLGDRTVQYLKNIVQIPKNLLEKFFNYIKSYFQAAHQDLPVELHNKFYIEREFRVIDPSKVPAKLQKGFQAAQRAMKGESVGDHFKYPPKIELDIPHEEDHALEEGVAFLQGRRQTMEDDHLMTTFNYQTQPVKLFGVFDGHGGAKASSFVRENLQAHLVRNLDRFGTTDDGIFNALKRTFVELDEAYKGKDGTTATVAFIHQGKIWVANVGDSRTVLDDAGKAEALSENAKPSLPKYRKGIEKREGFVSPYTRTHRVNGRLPVARAIGDHQILGNSNQRCVSPRPKITQMPLQGTHLILGCNELWDVAFTEQVVEEIQNNENSPCEVEQKLVQAAYSAGSTENISAMVIRL